MAVLGRVIETELLSRGERRQYALAIICASVLHLMLFQLLMFSGPETLEPAEDVIAVSLITLPPDPKIPGPQMPEVMPEPIEDPQDIDTAPLPPPPSVTPRPQATPPAPAVEIITPDILASSRPAASDGGNAVPLSNNGTISSPEPTPDERRIDEGLKAMAAELRCLKGFSEECAATRKDVFEEFQMTETDKVYTKKYAHTGMPAKYYGMSERQIRKELNLKFAGENGIYIPFTNIGIDGGLWDSLHGVNKGCEWKMSAHPTTGRQAPIKDCPDYLPAAKEDRDRRNKFQARLEANEARRQAENDSR